MSEHKQGPHLGESIDLKCAVVVSRLWMLIDGEYPAATSLCLARHLNECAACMAEFNGRARLKRLLRSRGGVGRAPIRLMRLWRAE
jgi:anti-sigma factor (TIGR02949 family)